MYVYTYVSSSNLHIGALQQKGPIVTLTAAEGDSDGELANVRRGIACFSISTFSLFFSSIFWGSWKIIIKFILRRENDAVDVSAS